MIAALVVVFVIAYTAIALEEPLRVNKSASALVGAGLLWTIYAMTGGNSETIDHELAQSLIDTAEIAFFLMGAMTIVEVIDTHGGFSVVTSRIRARTLGSFAWIVGFITFFLSAILDNLTTTIVMISLVGKLVADRDVRLYFAGLVVIAANAGGAWSPMGDVTTTMLWIGGQVSTHAIVTRLIVPSLVNMVVAVAIISFTMRGRPLVRPPFGEEREPGTAFERNLIFALGIGILLTVPVFKAVTHLPPYLGMLLGLGLLWTVADLMHRNKPAPERAPVSITQALTRIDMSAIVFFIGILLAVATLEHAHVLEMMARWLDAKIGRLDVIVTLFGLLSAVVDNVPMVAAAMGMYPMSTHPPDSFLWEFMAYCAGTGGSILIIGSAAGVAAMSIEKIDFLWYLRKFSLLALVGYLAGALAYIIQLEVL